MLSPVGWQHFLTLISSDFGHPVNFDIFKIHELCCYFSCPRSCHVSPACDCFLESVLLLGVQCFWSCTSLPTLVKKMPIPPPPKKKNGPFSFFSNLAKKSNLQFFGFPPHLRPVTLRFPPVSRVAGRTSSQQTRQTDGATNLVKWRAKQKKSWKPDVKLEALPILERKRSKLV